MSWHSPLKPNLRAPRDLFSPRSQGTPSPLSGIAIAFNSIHNPTILILGQRSWNRNGSKVRMQEERFFRSRRWNDPASGATSVFDLSFSWQPKRTRSLMSHKIYQRTQWRPRVKLTLSPLPTKALTNLAAKGLSLKSAFQVHESLGDSFSSQKLLALIL